MTQVTHTRGLDAVSKPQQDNIIGQLTQAYYESKTTGHVTAHISSPSPLPQPPPIDSFRGAIVTNAILSFASCPSIESLHFGTPISLQPIPRKSSVWLNSSSLNHERFADTMSELGPAIRQVKKY